MVYERRPHARSSHVAHRQPDYGRAGLGEQSHGGPKHRRHRPRMAGFCQRHPRYACTTPVTPKKGRSGTRSRLLAPRRVCASQPATTDLWLSNGTQYVEQPVSGTDSFTLELAGLVYAIATGSIAPVDGYWGRYIVAVALACEESSQAGEVVHIPPDLYADLTSW